MFVIINNVKNYYTTQSVTLTINPFLRSRYITISCSCVYEENIQNYYSLLLFVFRDYIEKTHFYIYYTCTDIFVIKTNV